MRFQRTSTKSDVVIICEHQNQSVSDRYYQVITEDSEVFSLRKEYVKKIFGKKKTFLSDYDDESSHKVFRIEWIQRKDPKNPKYYITNIITWEPWD